MKALSSTTSTTFGGFAISLMQGGREVVMSGWSANRVFAQIVFAPAAIAARMPGSVSGNDQPVSVAGFGCGAGVIMLIFGSFSKCTA